MRAAWIAGALLVTATAAGFVVGCQSVLGFQDFTTRSADASTGDDGPSSSGTDAGEDAGCTGGGDCSDPDAGSCVRKTYACNSGSPVCTASSSSLPDGTRCGSGEYCYGGTCAACRPGADCSPSGPGSNPCHQGITSCDGGVATCVEQTSFAGAGTACNAAGNAGGVCDSTGICVACSDNAPCTPSQGICLSGTESCGSGYQCNPGPSANEGKACNSSGSICRSGVCVPCDSTSCASGCCGSAGCIATNAQSASACGTGTACMTCTGGMTCQSGKCGCLPGQTSCGGTCETLDGSDAKNCGGCGKVCASGVCNAGQCAPYVVAGSGTTSLVSGIASDGTSLVWTDSGLKAVMSIPVAGTTAGQKATTVKSSSSFGQLGGVAISGSTIAWVMSTPNVAGISDSEIWTQAGEQYVFSGTSLAALYGPVLQSAGAIAPGVLSVFVEADGVNSSSQSSTGVVNFYSCPLNCSSLPCAASSCESTGGTSTGFTDGIVGNPSGVYYGVQPFGAGSGSYGVFFFNASGNIGFDWVDPPVFQGLSVDAKNAYWAQATTAAPNTFMVEKSPAQGASNASATSAGFPGFTASYVETASDGTNLYVLTQSTSGSSGTIQVMPLIGAAAPKTLYSGTAPVDLIAVGGAIYFVDSNVIYGLPYP